MIAGSSFTLLSQAYERKAFASSDPRPSSDASVPQYAAASVAVLKVLL